MHARPLKDPFKYSMLIKQLVKMSPSRLHGWVELRTTQANCCTALICYGLTFFVDSIGLHRVENPSHTETAISLHLYSPPFEICQTFDQRTGHKQKVKMTFYSQFGERTPYVSITMCLVICGRADRSNEEAARKKARLLHTVTMIRQGY